MGEQAKSELRICPGCQIKTAEHVCPRCGKPTQPLDEYMNHYMDPDELLGKVLLGRYRVIRLIGIGGMGNVYEVEHELFHKRFAIKVIRKQLLDDEEAVHRFQREALLAAKLDHPNIVKVFEFGSTDSGQHFILMEYVDGKTLRDILRHSGPMNPFRAAVIALQIAKALDHAHKKGVVHRDLKPDNIFVRNLEGEDFVKVVDFGVAKLLTKGESDVTLTKEGFTPGTPEYMSPEQVLARHDIDGRADIYSLGLILYEMVTGIRPFKKETPLASAVAHLKEDVPPFPPDIKAIVPPEFEALVFQMVSKSRHKRPATAAEVVQRLKSLRFKEGVIGGTTDPQGLVKTPRTPSVVTPIDPEVLSEEVATRLSGSEGKRGFKWWYLAVAVLFLAVVGGFLIWKTGAVESEKVKIVKISTPATKKVVSEIKRAKARESVLIYLSMPRRKADEIKASAIPQEASTSKRIRRKKRVIHKRPARRTSVPQGEKPVIPKW